MNIHIIIEALYRDLYGIYFLIKSESRLRYYEKHNVLAGDIFRSLAKRTPKKPCIIFDDTVWTFQDMENYSNKVANVFQKRFCLTKGDCVALFMENKPEFIGLWFGLAKLGVVSALINTNLKNQPLLHSLKAAQPKVIVFSAELKEAVDTVRKELNNEKQQQISFVSDRKVVGGSSRGDITLDLESLLKNASADIPIIDYKITGHDMVLFIYTSGTTGLPKPAVIKQSRYIAGGIIFHAAAGLTKNDVVYVALPIYHANGGIIGIGSALMSGATVVLRRKFSASNFWKDCVQYNCTGFVYVGEICRFLLNQPASALDCQHKIRKAIGNGLRINVWKEFYKRFGVKCVEFYAASEGNCTMINLTSKIGACGFVPLVNSLFNFLPIHLIRIDDQMNPIRDENGFCIKCKHGEKGLLIGIIGNSTKTAFNGYANNKEATKKKIIDNVFKKGQRAFNSGDLMMRDFFGYMYFCDRLGDTYRWRGENVSTIEVENVISSHLNSKEVIVYGVEVAGQEGRAGMAAILDGVDIDLARLSERIRDDLPAYARPLFIRLVKEIEHTGTFKTKKLNLIEEAYNVNKTNGDRLFYFDAKEQAYKSLTKNVYENILNGNIRI